MKKPAIVICTASARTDANRLWNAMGRGPDTFIRRLATGTKQNPPASNAVATHYLMLDDSVFDYDVVRWEQIAIGDVPGLDDNGNTILYGQNGQITQLEAITAGAGLAISTYVKQTMTQTELEEWRDGLLAGRNQYFIPDEL